MTHRNLHPVRPLCALLGLLAALAASPALAAGKAASSEAQARYQQELAACASAGYIGDRQACRREAAAARADRAALNDGAEAEQYQRNALMRCDRLPTAEQADCRLRMQGAGTTRGSAAAGGVYRELVTTVPAAAGAAPAASK